MKKGIVMFKVVALSVLVVVGILCLSYTNVYGLPSMSFQSSVTGSQSGTPGSSNPGTDVPGVTYEILPDYYPNEPTTGELPEDDGDVVPEPTTLILFGAGLAGVGLLRRKF